MAILIGYVVSETGLKTYEVFAIYKDGSTVSQGFHYTSFASARRAAQRQADGKVPVFVF